MKKAFFASIITYLIFFWQLFLPNYNFWKSDVQYTYIPARFYLYEKIFYENTFPFWTERMFLGFPIYADFENAYLNPINVLSILLFGPILSYKILHLISYLLGSICLYLWMRKKGFGYIGYFAANLIYFFNSFAINHQIHFNIIAGLYLFPTIIYLFDEIIEKFEIKKIILASLVISYIALWGHAQTTFLVCFGGLIYFLIFAYKKISIKKLVFFGTLLLLLTLVQILPQYIPSFNLYQTSLRESNIDFRQGSLIPRISSVVFIPYIFGEINNYIAPQLIYSEYTYTETYIYIGISTLILGVLGVYFSKKNRLFLVLYSYIIFFIVVSFNANNPLLTENTPIISIFRYWQRSMVLFSFSFAILVAIFLENFKEFILEKKNLLLSTILVLIPIIYLYTISFIPTNFLEEFKYEGFNRIKVITSLNNMDKIKNIEIIIFIVLFLLLLILLNYIFKDKIKNKIFKNFAPIILIFTVLFDLYFFNQDILNYRIDNISNYEVPKIEEKYNNLRILARKQNLEGMENLYVKSWSPFGYSQFREDEYIKEFNNLGIGNLKRSKAEYPRNNVDSLENFGIKHILEKELDISVSKKEVELIKENIEGEYLKKEEGKIELKLNSEKAQKIILLLKYNKNWTIKINNENVEYEKEGIFIGVKIPQGINKISIEYIPNDFYLGIYISLFILIPVSILIKFRKNLYE